MFPAMFGQRLRSLRVAAGMTRRKLARIAGLSGTCIEQAEQNLHELRQTTLAKLVAVFGNRLLISLQGNTNGCARRRR